jgi:hypothetical protein
VAPPPIVEDLDVLKMAFANSTRVFQRRELSSSICVRDQNACIIAVVTVADLPIDCAIPAFPSFCPSASGTGCDPWSD